MCFTEEANDWWGAALIRRHGSAVTGVAWHPDGDTLATICADGTCRVFHADPAGAAPSQGCCTCFIVLQQTAVLSSLAQHSIHVYSIQPSLKSLGDIDLRG